uniref:Uncharacterized protein n=1 Tax=Mimivirus LCMiAC01 TaxID=2506608 RepID=A0A481Z119_9VIRU|nr:MAG: hypothetical protein LCMiAC01_00400 [Mimivirus LCMiAC01]
MDTNDIDNLDGLSPENIANKIFNNDPKEPCSCQLIAPGSDGDLTYVFEVLLTILMEGFAILSGDITTIPLDSFSENSIMALNPWIQSMGLNLIVSEIDASNKEEYTNYYNRIVLNRDMHEQLFIIMRNNKSYHFLLNGDALEENTAATELHYLFAIFECKDKIFKIKFDFIKP